ncbi:HIT domain-containing protein [Salinisphaera aquimarina]|uniref:HIT domain-containing protein n=1 Tax=Salinisphaera aquimarina TaxID=2094031 RepID=A0ABV7EWJ7_9GAMM
MNIDPQLLRDCHVLGTLDRATVLLNRNASVGWLILVPETEAIDWHEVDDAEHDQISAQIRQLSGFTARWFSADKLNVATLGNVVAQMHIHVIARHHNDPCWPRPVWGHLDVVRDYPAAEVDALQHALSDDMGLVPGGMS